MKRVYVDTNIVSRLADCRVSEGTAEALSELSRRADITLVTSNTTKVEVLRTRDRKRAAVLEFLVALFKQVPNETIELSGAIGGAAIGALCVGGGWTHPLLQNLQQYFDRVDAEHIARAALSDCDFFLTLDEPTILGPGRSHQDAVEILLGKMRLVSPSYLVLALNAASGTI